ncbi:MAG: hypothetical protein NC123_02275 [Butyrivibrio sp.]|nr:hypothetical protein [Acetatifactor muris]MCM1558366.1 hypothetical protein [Butyrivibrio sp.]
MFMLEKNNKKIGAYLNKLILAKYEKMRRFCIAYVKLSGLDGNDSSVIAKMQNRMSQIIKGNKAIQIYDLPLFCELLGISCEEILSAGRHFAPISGHVTNYEIAFSKDKIMWDKYINHEDKLILNPDEYNKTVIDYALEFKNYDLLKYLMDNGYIWFVDDSKYDCHERAFGFSAGTSIKRREIGYQDTLGVTLKYHCEERGLRQKMIALAIGNQDFGMLDCLRAREVPALYQACCYMNPQTKCKDYYDENVVIEIAKSNNDKVFSYFSEDFLIIDQFECEHWFIYPYMGKLLGQLIANKNKYVEAVLRRTIDHNKRVYNKLREMVNEAFERSEHFFNHNDSFKVPVETVVGNIMHYYQFDDEDGFLSYMFAKAKKDYLRFCANVIYVEEKSDNFLVHTLIEELNRSYEAVRNIQPDVSAY